MTIEYLPNGVACDLACKYCYQDNMRAAGNISAPLSFTRVKDVLTKQGAPFAVFGGEVLLTPKAKLEEIFKFGYGLYGENSIQTNGLRIDSDHIELFKKYNVGIGVSIDGWGELNSPRSTDRQTQTILGNLTLLKQSGITPSIIITIHRSNAKPELLRFIHWVHSIGIHNINLHILETDSAKVKVDLELTNAENFEIFSMIYDEFRDKQVYISPFTDIKELLTKDQPKTNCVWNACDAVNTQAVVGVAPDGSLINCGRTNKDGVNWVKTSSRGKERYLSLYNTPQEFGGCADCKFFFACKGQCPGTAIAGDWRNKTSHCDFWYSLLEYIWLDLAASGPVFSMQQMRAKGRLFIESITHGNSPHGDSPHGDEHGDHTDGMGVPAIWRD